jgi:hypothetical protein
MLSAQWLSREIVMHVERLLQWEIVERPRVSPDSPSKKTAGMTTMGISPAAWERVRDGLADLWDWWGEGVHLRPQPELKQKIWSAEASPYVVKMAILAMRRVNFRKEKPPHTIRTATIDANLGVGLFQLNCFVHFFISEAKGWKRMASMLGAKDMWAPVKQKPRRYQVGVQHEDALFIQFAPSGESRTYFRNYMLRIDGAGLDPPGSHGPFPSGTSMMGVYLREASLQFLVIARANLAYCNFEGAQLSWAFLSSCNLELTNFRRAQLDHASLVGVRANATDFDGAGLTSVDFKSAMLDHALGLTPQDIICSD